MKKLIAITTIALATSVHATIIDTVNPGYRGTGIIQHLRDPMYIVQGWHSNLNGTQFTGQSLQYDVLFQNFFLRTYTFTQTRPLSLDLYLPYLPYWTTTNPPPTSPSITGTATFLDVNGQPISSAFALHTALSGGPTVQPTDQLWFYPQLGNSPLDIYGIQFDLNLSDTPGASLANNPRDNSLTFQGFFGVGPGRIPRNVVPDGGMTSLMFGGALVALFWVRRRMA